MTGCSTWSLWRKEDNETFSSLLCDLLDCGVREASCTLWCVSGTWQKMRRILFILQDWCFHQRLDRFIKSRRCRKRSHRAQSHTRAHTNTHRKCLFFVNLLDNSDYYHALSLLGSFFFPPSICLPVCLSEENGIWWALAFLMTWLISGRLVVQFCVYACMISFKHSNAKIHTDSHQLIPIKAISVNYLKTQLREVAPHFRKIPE